MWFKNKQEFLDACEQSMKIPSQLDQNSNNIPDALEMMNQLMTEAQAQPVVGENIPTQPMGV